MERTSGDRCPEWCWLTPRSEETGKLQSRRSIPSLLTGGSVSVQAARVGGESLGCVQGVRFKTAGERVLRLQMLALDVCPSNLCVCKYVRLQLGTCFPSDRRHRMNKGITHFKY